MIISIFAIARLNFPYYNSWIGSRDFYANYPGILFFSDDEFSISS